MSINKLPNEIFTQTLEDLYVKDILSICSTDKNIQYICNDNVFWRDYVNKNYNIPVPYKYLAQLYEKQIPIELNAEVVGFVVINHKTTLRQILKDVDAIVPINKSSNKYDLELLNVFEGTDYTTILVAENYIYYQPKDYVILMKYNDADKPIYETGLYNNLLLIIKMIKF